MRTTMDLNDAILRQAKKKAVDEGRSVKAIVEDALQLYLNPKAPAKPYKLKWGEAKGGGLQPGVDLNDWDALRDLMDGIRK